MPIIALFLAAPSAEAVPASLATCRAVRLRVSLDGRNGDFDGMSHSGVKL